VKQRVRAPDGTRWVIRRTWLVWPRWRGRGLEGVDGPSLGSIPWDGIGDLGALDDFGLPVLGTIAAAIAVFLIVSALVVLLLPALVFGVELLALPFVALAFRGRRVVEARNHVTGERIRFWVASRAEARERERELARELGTAPHAQDAVRVLRSRATS
jgi:hypothetical protein